MNGQCTCGAVRYRLTSSPLFVHCCHCRWCQRETGASIAVNAVIEADRVELQAGEPQMVDLSTDSGMVQTAARCPICRIGLWSTYDGVGKEVCFVKVSTLENPDELPPALHIYTKFKQPWVVHPANTPAVPEYYNRKDYWPAESLARWLHSWW